MISETVPLADRVTCLVQLGFGRIRLSEQKKATYANYDGQARVPAYDCKQIKARYV